MDKTKQMKHFIWRLIRFTKRHHKHLVTVLSENTKVRDVETVCAIFDDLMYKITIESGRDLLRIVIYRDIKGHRVQHTKEIWVHHKWPDHKNIYFRDEKEWPLSTCHLLPI